MRRTNPRAALGLLICLALAAAIAVLIFQAMPLLEEVRLLAHATPSPTPAWGNVLTVTPDPSATAPPASLRAGSSGEEVALLQSRLKALGYYDGEADGQFGPATQGAVTRFQRANGLDDDGVAGPATLSLLYSAAARAFTATEAPRATETPDPRRSVPYETADGLPLLVNRSRPLPEDYQPKDLVRLSAFCDSNVVRIKYDSSMAEREAADALVRMLRAAQADGILIWQVSSAYRTWEEQQSLLDAQVRDYVRDNGLSEDKALSAALQTVAAPGTSEHQLGTCFDITVPGVSFKGTAQHKWLLQHCWEHGFILRYPEDKSGVTGFLPEAWHYRWVGVRHSLIMRDENLTLEEYLQRYGN